MDPQSALQAKSDRMQAFVAPMLAPDEEVTAVLALGVGPLSPLTPLIPVVGAVLAMTRWLRGYGVVVTNERFLLIRGTQRRAHPKQLDLAVPVGQVRVTAWVQRRSSAVLKLDADGRSIRLHVVGEYFLQMPALLEALGHPADPGDA